MNNEIFIKRSKLDDRDTLITVKPNRMYIGGRPFTSVEIRQHDDAPNDEFGELTLFTKYVGDSVKNENGFYLQIRAMQPLKDKGVPRSIIATISIADSEVLALADFVARKRKDYNTVKLDRATNIEK